MSYTQNPVPNPQHRTLTEPMSDPGEQKRPEAAIAEVERLRDKLVSRPASTDSAWSVTGWRSVDWLLLALVIAFVLYVLLPRF